MQVPHSIKFIEPESESEPVMAKVNGKQLAKRIKTKQQDTAPLSPLYFLGMLEAIIRAYFEC